MAEIEIKTTVESEYDVGDIVLFCRYDLDKYTDTIIEIINMLLTGVISEVYYDYDKESIVYDITVSKEHNVGNIVTVKESNILNRLTPNIEELIALYKESTK